MTNIPTIEQRKSQLKQALQTSLAIAMLALQDEKFERVNQILENASSLAECLASLEADSKQEKSA